jgi:LysM repeat protein
VRQGQRALPLIWLGNTPPRGVRTGERCTLSLELGGGASYCRRMKRISFLLVTLTLCASPAARGQDAATQERLDKLSGRIEDLTAAQEALKKQISELTRELESVREQSGKPNASYARQEDLNRLAEAIKEVDRKRMDDAEKIRTELLKLRKVLEAPLASPKQKAASLPKEKSAPEKSATPEKGFEYVVKSGDTLDAIAQAYKEKSVKVTVAQILNANPGLKAERLRVGQKIFIPAPQP